MGKSKKSKNQAAQAKPAPQAAASKRKAPVIPVTIAFVVVLVVIAVIAGSGANQVSLVDGKVTRTIATVDECASATLPLTIPAGETIEDAAESIFDALSKTTGVGVVTVYEDDPRVQIAYCQSNSTEPALREVLAPTGYLAP